MYKRIAYIYRRLPFLSPFKHLSLLTFGSLVMRRSSALARLPFASADVGGAVGAAEGTAEGATVEEEVNAAAPKVWSRSKSIASAYSSTGA